MLTPPPVHTDTADFATILLHLPAVSESLGTQLPGQGCYHKHEFQACRLATETGPIHSDHVPPASDHTCKYLVP